MSNDKWVRRFSVDESARHKNGFTIYKITSVLFPISSPEALSIVSVWKRYSDVQRLHAAMRSLHSGLHLRGVFPVLPKHSFFRRFQQEVIEERAKVIQAVLEFIAEHKLLFSSTEFVNFLQTGYPEPETSGGGVINAIRSSLHLPIEDTAPLEYPTSDDDSRSPTRSARPPQPVESDFISQIEVFEAADVERRVSPVSRADSFESLASLDSISSDLYSELEKVTIQKPVSMVKKNVLPDLINFDAPSTSRFEDYHTMKTESDTTSLSSNIKSESSFTRSNSRVSSKSVLSLSNLQNVECKTKTEDSYVFEAGYMLNLAARYEDMKEYARAFECYKAGIEKMLIGVQSDTDPQRRALIKEKTNKYLSYAEAIYKNHLCDTDQSLLSDKDDDVQPIHCPIPVSMLRRPYEELAMYRVIAVVGNCIMLVLHRGEQKCYAMKVIQKIPNNLTEFDEYFLQNTRETRQPILPTLIPYMVPLNAYIETNNLIFLILSYAPGEKLFDYIKNYVKSIPNTPAREVNLENVFTEPKIKLEVNLNSIIEVETKGSDVSVKDKIEPNDNNNKTDIGDIDISELVLNSQKLLKNVDKALSDVSVKVDNAIKVEDVNIEIVGESAVGNVINTRKNDLRPTTPTFNRGVLPPAAACGWAAQLLTALESLHNCGVVCRDLNPSNILLADGGQIILTYFICYPGAEMCLSKLQSEGESNMYIAPELHSYTCVEERDEMLERVCDFWSFGAIMYELLCGVPLSYYHRSVFTSHTILQLPDGLSVEVQSLLTQLLTYEPSERLGGGKDGIEEIKRHPYFKHIDWAEVYNTWVVPG